MFVQLYKVTYHACAAFSFNEELMQMYTRQVILNSASALGSGASALSNAIEVGALMQARAALRPEGWMTRLGRSVGLVTRATPQELAKRYTGQIAGATFATAWSLGSLGVSVYGAVQAKYKRDCCDKMAYLIFQTWQAAAEGNTFLRWVYTSGANFRFQDGKGREWEEFLKGSLGSKTLEAEWKQARSVKVYLQGRNTELSRLRTELQYEAKELFK